MKEIYLDNSATTPLSSAARVALIEAAKVYGNPSSLHPVGEAAHKLLEQSRRQIAATLGVRGTLLSGQLIFTACGSESDNLAIFGTAYAKPRRRGGRVITTDSEHSAVENAMKALEADGFEVVRIPTGGGVLDLDAFASALNDKTFLVSLMMVNNETGAHYDIARAFSMAKAKNPNIVTHTDAVQGYLKIPFTPQSIKADLISISAHKVHAPKGVGALYVSPEALKRRDLVPTLYGGGQEGGFRSGTENLIGIASFAAAASDGYANLSAHTETMRTLRDYAEERLAELPVRINRPTGARAPHILHLTLPDIRSETMLHELSKDGICISNGSACSSHAKQLSRALLGFGLTEREIPFSIRVSVSPYNTKEEIDVFVSSLSRALDTLVRSKR
ncbi:MAG: cysteine desulfurase [Clostridia bacterium]|nr:cysteine desulfurase [Clostridia bacterium]